MKLTSETIGIAKLAEIRGEFAAEIREEFEPKAKPCSVCETPGACCLDEHFVNVRVTRIEARAIRERLRDLPAELLKRVIERAEEAIDRYGLHHAVDVRGTYACPLFEKGVGCLVHDTAKPLPCIAHACYDRKEDLPPEELLLEWETEIAELNRRVYGKNELPLPIPIAMIRPGPV